ncbi:MAG: thiolase family protein [Deltaproteobacteria bacterium]|nr:thiolase family protein [Deltaproteobacteria bacterium]
MRVFCLDIRRSPFRKIFTGFENYSTLDLGVSLVESFFVRNNTLLPNLVLASSVLLDPEIPNLAREIVIRSSLPKDIPATFVSNYCISSLVSSATAFGLIRSGNSSKVLCVGVEVMSTPKLFISQKGSQKLIRFMMSKTLTHKFKSILKLRPSDLYPVVPSPKEPSTGLTMGQSCELMNSFWNISRQEQDEYAYDSHMKAISALKNNMFETQIVTTFGVSSDNIPRPDTSMEKLSTLSAVFSSDGSITAGNSSSLTDGGSIALFVDESELSKAETEPLCEIVDYVFSAVDPSDGLLMAPVVAIDRLLKRNKLAPNQVDFYEIHEAFACQVLINLKCLSMGWSKYNVEKTEIPLDRVNVFGGSLAYGHPFAATGLRLILHAAKALNTYGGTYAIIASCAAGGGGCAMLVKRPM